VNNAIVLVDYVNQLKQRGHTTEKALELAGKIRLRPILMTTLTTVLGLLPMALGIGDGAEIRMPMAITVIAGLACSTLLTLIVIPTIYAGFDRFTGGDNIPRDEMLHNDLARVTDSQLAPEISLDSPELAPASPPSPPILPKNASPHGQVQPGREAGPEPGVHIPNLRRSQAPESGKDAGQGNLADDSRGPNQGPNRGPGQGQP
ncbi:MAG: efflux RND transporter permease subunit, partial [Nannocystaceae bacterium]